MSANDNPPSDTSVEFAVLDKLEQDLTVGISLAEARVQRLVSEAFVSPAGAERSLKLLIIDKGVDHAIKVLMGNGFANARHFGPLRGSGFLKLSRTASRAALEQLPEKLRDLNDLNKRLSEAQVARQNLRHTLAARVKSPLPENKPDLNNTNACVEECFERVFNRQRNLTKNRDRGQFHGRVALILLCDRTHIPVVGFAPEMGLQIHVPPAALDAARQADNLRLRALGDPR